jgi:hypothetical protein
MKEKIMEIFRNTEGVIAAILNDDEISPSFAEAQQNKDTAITISFPWED